MKRYNNSIRNFLEKEINRLKINGLTLEAATVIMTSRMYDSYILNSNRKIESYKRDNELKIDIKKTEVFLTLFNATIYMDAIKYLLYNGSKSVFPLRPDIVLYKNNNPIIMDTKWKMLKKDLSNVSQGDLYQMVAYGLKYNAKDIWLLYPKTEGLNAGKIIDYHTLEQVIVLDKLKSIKNVKSVLK